jgi:1,4-alpha-glucan branching enzyme
MAAGYFTFVLHSHLPYVLGHGRWPHGVDWLNEATAETYIPVLRVCENLVARGISPKLTLGISPVLCEQMAHPSFKSEFVGYLGNRIDSASRDMEEFSRTGSEDLLRLAGRWKDFYSGLRQDFVDNYGSDILSRFRSLQDGGQVEIITCAATHGYLPLLSRDETCQAQIKQAVASYRRFFGRDPRGIWLPECAYRPGYEWSPPVSGDNITGTYKRKGIEEFLSENLIEYFFIDSAMLKGGKAIGVYVDRFEALKTLWGKFEKQYRPRSEDEEKTPLSVYLVGGGEGRRPVGVFTRHPETSLQVWSGEWGYPGDGNYLDFHKKRFPGGHRYWKVTSAKTDLADKEIYDPDAINGRLEENASHFTGLVARNLGEYYEQSGVPGIVVAPFDSELFGHWWFEGPAFLERVLSRLASSPDINLCTAGEFFDQSKPSRIINLPEGSWGEGGYHYIWLNEWTDWTWKHIYEDEMIMKRLAARYREGSDLGKRIIRQAARELMLLASSDWQFLISTWAARDYAESRVAVHHEAFRRLLTIAEDPKKASDGDLNYLQELEERDSLFPDIDPLWFEKIEFPS